MNGYFTSHNQTRFQPNGSTFTSEQIEGFVFNLIRNDMAGIEYYLQPEIHPENEGTTLSRLMMNHIKNNTLPHHDELSGLISKRSLIPGLNEWLVCEATSLIARGAVLTISLGFPGATLVMEKLIPLPRPLNGNYQNTGVTPGRMYVRDTGYIREETPRPPSADVFILELMKIAPKQAPWISPAVQPQYRQPSRDDEIRRDPDIRLRWEIEKILTIAPSFEAKWAPQHAEILRDYLGKCVPLSLSPEDFRDALCRDTSIDKGSIPHWFRPNYMTALTFSQYVYGLPPDQRDTFWNKYRHFDSDAKNMMFDRMEYVNSSITNQRFVEFRINLEFITEYIRKRLASVLVKLESLEIEEFTNVVTTALIGDITTTEILTPEAVSVLVRGNLPDHVKESGIIIIYDRVTKTLRETRALLEIFTHEDLRRLFHALLDELREEVSSNHFDNHVVAGLFRKMYQYTHV